MAGPHVVYQGQRAILIAQHERRAQGIVLIRHYIYTNAKRDTYSTLFHYVNLAIFKPDQEAREYGVRSLETYSFKIDHGTLLCIKQNQLVGRTTIW